MADRIVLQDHEDRFFSKACICTEGGPYPCPLPYLLFIAADLPDIGKEAK